MLRTLHTEEGVPYEYGPRVVSVFRGTPDILPFLAPVPRSSRSATIYQGTRLRPDYPVIPFPVDLESLRELPCGAAIERELAEIRERRSRTGRRETSGSTSSRRVGPTLTELAFEGFNRKFWGRRLEEMPADWGKLRRLERIAEVGEFRLPSVRRTTTRSGGFNPLFEQMLAGIDVRCETPVRDGRRGRRAAGRQVGRRGAGPPTSSSRRLRSTPCSTTASGPLEWRGYRIETEVVDGTDGSELGLAPDGIPFAWVYTPWAETPVCRTTDFGVIHHGPERARPAVILREIVDDSVSMYPVWWEDERFYRYLEEATPDRAADPARPARALQVRDDGQHALDGPAARASELESYLGADRRSASRSSARSGATGTTELVAVLVEAGA